MAGKRPWIGEELSLDSVEYSVLFLITFQAISASKASEKITDRKKLFLFVIFETSNLNAYVSGL